LAFVLAMPTSMTAERATMACRCPMLIERLSLRVVNVSNAEARVCVSGKCTSTRRWRIRPQPNTLRSRLAVHRHDRAVVRSHNRSDAIA
jgi:hypothetical protein